MIPLLAPARRAGWGARLVRIVLLATTALGWGCRRREDDSKPARAPVVTAPADRDEIPAEQLDQVIAAHYRGLGHMERYEYAAAAAAFRDAHERAPGWIAGTVNLAIALFNLGGEAQAEAKRAGGNADDRVAVQNIEAARHLFDQVLVRVPDQRQALFSRGIILSSQGFVEEAHRDFQRVVDLDPNDGHAWMELGGTMTDPNDPGMPIRRDLVPRQIEIYRKALEVNPNLSTVYYKLTLPYGMLADRAHQNESNGLMDRLSPLRNPANSGDVAALVYGEMGKYARVMDPFRRPDPPPSLPPSPRFAPPATLVVALPPGDRWATAADFVGPHAVIGRARDRFGAGVATLDVNRDGRVDLYLTAAVVGPAGLRDCLLVNTGGDRFADQTAEFGLPLDRAGIGVAAADFDADLFVDLYLTGPGNNRLFRHDGRKFVEVTQQAGVAQPGVISLTARWFDIDQDGDLDLYVINHALLDTTDRAFAPAETGAGRPNSVYRNDGRPTPAADQPAINAAPLAMTATDPQAGTGLTVAFATDWPGREALEAGSGRHTAVAFLDIDDDRDFDLVVAADGTAPQVISNDRAGRFHTAPIQGWGLGGAASGLVALDLNKDGLTDLMALGVAGRSFAWVNTTPRAGTATAATGIAFPTNTPAWRTASVVDLDLDTWADVVGLPSNGSDRDLDWSRNDGRRLTNQPAPTVPPPGPLVPPTGATVADIVGDALPDLIMLRPGQGPQVARNLGNGWNWLVVDPSGRWKTNFDLMRTNSEGLGTRLALEGAGLFNPLDVATLEAGTAQSVGPVVLGMGSHPSAPLLRVRWPDGVMQAELNVAANKTLKLVENNRKTGSCPILFTWNGAGFTCQGDFAGAAGLGFLEAPGVYHPPDRDEAVQIPAANLRIDRGLYHLRIVEPMDEVAYLDHLTLDVVDSPPATATGLDERFAFEADRPTGDLVAWTRSIFPVAAHDLAGRDHRAVLRDVDRRCVEPHRIRNWIGYAEPHGIVLDFGDQLDALAPGSDLRLCLTGWVEYPYSQTNYAAALAGVRLDPPTLEQQRSDGGWEVIDPTLGHPAGLPRQMTKAIHPRPGPEFRAVFRIRTNMDCSWDQAFVAVVGPTAARSVRVTTLAPSRAEMGDRGYLRETSRDGQLPTLPDYDRVDPAPLARFRGQLTRHGDVLPLLLTDDDRLCVMGPGDEVRLEFAAADLPPLVVGWTRSFVFRSIAYCKDADPFTATSDAVEPLPWRAMPAFPPPDGVERPVDPGFEAYLREYQTRPAGGP